MHTSIQQGTKRYLYIGAIKPQSNIKNIIYSRAIKFWQAILGNLKSIIFN